MQASEGNRESKAQIDFQVVAGAVPWQGLQQLDGLCELCFGFLIGEARCRLLSGLAPTGDRLFRKSGFREMSRQ